jgi:hypothetical protein
VFLADADTGDARVLAYLVAQPDVLGRRFKTSNTIDRASWDGDALTFGTRTELTQDEYGEAQTTTRAYRVVAPGALEESDYARLPQRTLNTGDTPEQLETALVERSWLTRYAIESRKLLPVVKPIASTTKRGAQYPQFDSFELTTSGSDHKGRIRLSSGKGWPSELWVVTCLFPPRDKPGPLVMLEPARFIPLVNHKASDGGSWGPVSNVSFFGHLTPQQVENFDPSLRYTCAFATTHEDATAHLAWLARDQSKASARSSGGEISLRK